METEAFGGLGRGRVFVPINYHGGGLLVGMVPAHPLAAYLARELIVVSPSAFHMFEGLYNVPGGAHGETGRRDQQ
jgi:hypothetical protein